MKIAIASSGLGHITRGIETWALDTANALHRTHANVTLFAAAAVPQAEAPAIVLPCLKRNDRITRIISRYAPGWSWRWHLKSGYDIEQFTFWTKLRRELRAGQFDILHVQDPFLAALAQKAYEQGQTKTRSLLAHGTEETSDYLRRFPFLQHLAPWHLAQTLKTLTGSESPAPGSAFQYWKAIPNFVDTARFHPITDPAARRILLTKLQLPPDKIIIGTAAAIKKHHKRIDWLITEFAQAAARNPHLHLVIAGSRQHDTDELRHKANALVPGKVSFFIDYPHEQMPALLQVFDIFVLTSLFEMMPIAILEAIATGLPVLTHTHPVLDWMVGPGGIRLPMDAPGALTQTLLTLDAPQRSAYGKAARQHALALFSECTVIPRYLAWYHTILNS